MSQNKLPKISVITPSFNSAKYLSEAIESVLSQNYPNFEHIIVDGGSTDGTLDILKKYPHLRWVSEPDNGQSDAMNKGFKMSIGEVIVYLNADDYFIPDVFNKIVSYFGNGAKFVVGKVKVLNEDGTYWINDPTIKFNEMLKWWNSTAYSYNPVGYFYLREVQENVGGFNINNHYSMDVEFLFNCVAKYTFTKIDILMGVYRFFPGTKTYMTCSIDDLEMKMKFIEAYINDPKEKQNYLIQKKQYYSRLIREEKAAVALENFLNAIEKKKFCLYLIYSLKLILIDPEKYGLRAINKIIKKIKR